MSCADKYLRDLRRITHYGLIVGKDFREEECCQYQKEDKCGHSDKQSHQNRKGNDFCAKAKPAYSVRRVSKGPRLGEPDLPVHGTPEITICPSPTHTHTTHVHTRHSLLYSVILSPSLPSCWPPCPIIFFNITQMPVDSIMIFPL